MGGDRQVHGAEGSTRLLEFISHAAISPASI
jgi:hypothetical protein